MRVSDGLEGFHVHDKLISVNAILPRRRNLLPSVHAIRYTDSVARLAGRYACHSLDDWLERQDVIISVIHMTTGLELLDHEVELLTVELLVQRLRLATEEVEFPQGLLRQRQIVIVKGFVDDIKNPFGATNVVQDQKDAPSLLQNPIQVGIIRQAVAKGQRTVQCSLVGFGLQLPRDIFGRDGGRDLVVGPPGSRHGQSPGPLAGAEAG